MRILITGASGLLGSKLFNELKDNHLVLGPTHKELDILNKNVLDLYFRIAAPDLVIHCAAVSKFADAEKDPIKAINTNVNGTANIVMACIENNSRLVFISTSHVFDGETGYYKSTDRVNPLTIYSKTKVAGENIVSTHTNSLIIRTEFCDTTFPFDTAYTDKYSSKEYIDVLLPRLIKASLSHRTGIMHIAGPRRSFYDFGKLRNPRVKKGSVQELVKTSPVPILIDTSLISDD